VSRSNKKKTTHSRSSRPKQKPAASQSTSPHVDQANKYAKLVVAGKIPASKWVRLACKRHLDDLQRSKQRNFQYRFDPAKAERPCRFVEALPHTKGKWASAGETITLGPWQCFIICVLFGWLVKSTGKYRFREAYIKVPRKNGKSILGSSIGLFKFAADGEFGAEVYSGATTEKQAWEVFRPARLMVERTQALQKAFGITVNAKSLTILSNGSKFEPLIGKPGDGASPSCAIVDEYHEHPDDTLYDTMKTGMGARENPLLLVITTAGSDRSGPCYSLEKDVEKVLEGTLQNDRLFGIMYGIDQKDDWKSEAALIKANPNYGVSVFSDFLLDAQRDAINNARKQNVFKTKHLDEWVNAGIPGFNMAKWDDLAIQPSRQQTSSARTASKRSILQAALTLRRRSSCSGATYRYLRTFSPRKISLGSAASSIVSMRRKMQNLSRCIAAARRSVCSVANAWR
jgi:phage terminase large subunit-like protein